jgi:uncharacterized membrane protein
MVGRRRRGDLASDAVLAIFPISTGYEVVGLLHLLAVVIAFGPLFFYPSLQRAGAGATVAKLHLRLSLPALALAWVFGMALVGMSDEAIEMSETWVILAIIGWVVLMVVSWFLIRPALTDTSVAAKGRLAMGIGITHLLLIVLLYLMVFKPGSELT